MATTRSVRSVDPLVVIFCSFLSLLASLALAAPLIAAEPPAREVLPKPTFENSFCLFPICESWHTGGTVEERRRLTRQIDEMRAALGPERLYAHFGVAIISEGNDPHTFSMARELGIGLVLQGGMGEHHLQHGPLWPKLKDPKVADRRWLQWFQDGRLTENFEDPLALRACASRYALEIYEMRRKAGLARAKQLAQDFRDYADVILAVSGPIECEMNHVEDRAWADYGPFTIAEFRDYLTHRGIYAPSGERKGLGFPEGGRFADDPSPAEAKGNHPTFNDFFGTKFTTWSLRYWDPEKFPDRLPLEADPLPKAGQGFIAGGFDAPRVWPGPEWKGIAAAEGNGLFWDAWAGLDEKRPGFRVKLLNFWIAEHSRWLTEAGVPRDRIFSHQIPAESYGYQRLSRGASAVISASTPHNNIGITTFLDSSRDPEAFEKVSQLSPNWGIFEYHPHPIGGLKIPLTEYLLSLNQCVRYRAHILTPIAWDSKDNDFLVSAGPFADAIKQTVAALPDQPYFNRTYVDYAPPEVTYIRSYEQKEDTRVVWSPRLWQDRPFTWTDWREFSHFEVRDASLKVLATTRQFEAFVPAKAAGLTVTPIKRSAPPTLPAVTLAKIEPGRLRWNDEFSFYFDHYRVDMFAAQSDDMPIKTVDTRQPYLVLNGVVPNREVWCQVTVCDGAGKTGPASPRVRLDVSPPGEQLIELRHIEPRLVNSPDTHWKTGALVGHRALPALFQHPPHKPKEWSEATFRIDLPKLGPGEAWRFAAECGLETTGAQGDGVLIKVDINGEPRFNHGIPADGRWHELFVDLSAYAGQEISLTLRNNSGGDPAGDWFNWGDPRIIRVPVLK